jgi:hypothetical protein
MFLIVFLTETVGSGTRAFVYVLPSSEICLLMVRCAPKGYVICLLAVLNSRQSLRRDMSSENSFLVRLSSLSEVGLVKAADEQKNASSRRRNQPNVNGGVSITTEVYTYVGSVFHASYTTSS